MACSEGPVSSGEPDEIAAPGETGVSCVWRMDCVSWAGKTAGRVQGV